MNQRDLDHTSKLYAEIGSIKGVAKALGMTPVAVRYRLKKAGTYVPKPQSKAKAIPVAGPAPAPAPPRVRWPEEHDRYCLVGVCRGAEPHLDFINNIDTYAKITDAIVVLVEVGSHNKALREWAEEPLHPRFAGYPLIPMDEDGYEWSPHKNVRVVAPNVKPQNVNPLTRRITKTMQEAGQSIVVGHPQLLYKPLASSAEKLPRVGVSTGVCTLPEYLPNSVGYGAKYDHTFGFCVLEIVDESTFHLRQVEADDNGDFFDLCRTPSGHQITPEALVLGDWHTEILDPDVRALTHELVAKWRPHNIAFHDIFDGWSVSHHEEKQHVGRYRAKGTLDLETELRGVLTELQDMHAAHPGAHLHIVKSNHDEWLERLLQRAEFKHQDQNLSMLGLLLHHYCEGHMPLKSAVDHLAGAPLPYATWHPRDVDLNFCGVSCGHHGDLGANGSRGSLLQYDINIGDCVIGHSHTPGRLTRAMQVGMSGRLKTNYNHGPSSWMHAHALVYPNGTKQLVTIVNGAVTKK